MSLYKRGKYWFFDFVRNGTRHQGSTRQTNVNKARLVEAKKISEAGLAGFGIEAPKAVPEFSDFMENRFLDYCQRMAKAKRTHIFYKEKTKQLLTYEWKTLKLNAITGDEINGYVKWRLKSVSSATVNHELATLRKAFRLAREWGILREIPTVRLMPAKRGRDFTVSAELEAAFLEVASYPLRQVAVLLLDLGLRPEEAVFLRKSDIFDNAIHVRAGKSHNAVRTLPITDRANTTVELLFALFPESEWLIPGRKGQAYTRGALDNAFTKLRNAQNWPKEFVLYSFRHTYGTNLAQSGANPFEIKALMGHSSVKVSERYIHPSSDGLELAAKRKEIWDKIRRGESLSEEVPTGKNAPR